MAGSDDTRHYKTFHHPAVTDQTDSLWSRERLRASIFKLLGTCWDTCELVWGLLCPCWDHEGSHDKIYPPSLHQPVDIFTSCNKSGQIL